MIVKSALESIKFMKIKLAEHVYITWAHKHYWSIQHLLGKIVEILSSSKIISHIGMTSVTSLVLHERAYHAKWQWLSSNFHCLLFLIKETFRTLFFVLQCIKIIVILSMQTTTSISALRKHNRRSTMPDFSTSAEHRNVVSELWMPVSMRKCF